MVIYRLYDYTEGHIISNGANIDISLKGTYSERSENNDKIVVRGAPYYLLVSVKTDDNEFNGVQMTSACLISQSGHERNICFEGKKGKPTGHRGHDGLLHADLLYKDLILDYTDYSFVADVATTIGDKEIYSHINISFVRDYKEKRRTILLDRILGG